MQLKETGESRVRGYLFVLERSLRTFLPELQTLDAVREVESHIRDRVAETEPVPDERVALERVLGELGPPLTVARAYSAEMSAVEAVTTGRVIAVVRSLVRVAATGVGWFFGAILAFVGYATGLAFLALAVMKPVFPNNIGLWVINGIPRDFGAQFPPPAGGYLIGGFWTIILVSSAIGVAILLGTHILVRRALGSWLTRRRARAGLRA
jgi:HAAS domain-containing protein